MAAIKVPNTIKESKTSASIPYLKSRIPSSDEFAILSPELVNATAKLGRELTRIIDKWTIAGDVGELLLGVNVRPDRIDVLTTRGGCSEISERLSRDQEVRTGANPREVERELERQASIAGISYRVRVRSYLSEIAIEGARVRVHGDLQIKVGEWEWGDALDFEPETANIMGVCVPVVPLELKRDLYSGLGWTDLVRKIDEALLRRHHRLGLATRR